MKAKNTYGWVVVGIATVASIVSNIDRQLVAALISPIQAALRLTDTEFGALQGLAYGIPYAVLGLFIANLSDRFSRSLIISLALALWSGATVASGLAGSYAQLFGARMVVGLGESALLPAVYSLVSDMLPSRQLGRAMGVYFQSTFLGSALAFLLTGTVLRRLGTQGECEFLGFHLHAWQLTFLLAGSPGILLALVFGSVVRDPRAIGREARRPSAQPPFPEVIRYLIERRDLFVPHLVGFPLLASMLYNALAWASAYLTRTGHLSAVQVGVWLANVSIIAGGGGAFIGGAIMDALVVRQRRAAPFEVGVAAAVVATICVASSLVAPGHWTPFIVISAGIFLGPFATTTSAHVIQTVAPALYRARVSAIFLVTMLFFQAFSAFSVGFLDDHVFGGPQGIRLSLPVVMSISGLTAAIVLGFGRRPLDAAMSARADVRPLGVN